METLIDDAERLCLQQLVLSYLRPVRRNAWVIAGAEVEAHRVFSRTGVPDEARTIRYTIRHHPGAWAVRVRAVWLDEGLLRPLGTHVAVEGYHDLEDLHGEAGVREHFGAWLRALPL